MTESAFKFSSTEPSTAPRDLCFLQNAPLFFFFHPTNISPAENALAQTHTHTHPPDVCLSIVYTQNAQTRTTRGPRELAPKLPDCPAFTSMCGEAAVPQVAFFFLFFLFNKAAISGEGRGGG